MQYVRILMINAPLLLAIVKSFPRATQKGFYHAEHELLLVTETLSSQAFYGPFQPFVVHLITSLNG